MAVGFPAAMFVSHAAEPPETVQQALTAEAYPDRMRGIAALEAWARESGVEGEAWLVGTAGDAEDPELRAGAGEVLRRLVLERLDRERPGFVGIRMHPVALDDRRFGVAVDLVEPGTPAEQAGLARGDVIVKLDGRGWSDPLAQDRFAFEIAARRGGDRVRLTVVSPAGEQREVEFELMSRPWDKGEYRSEMMGAGGRVPNAEAARDEAFHDWLRQRLGPAE